MSALQEPVAANTVYPVLDQQSASNDRSEVPLEQHDSAQLPAAINTKDGSELEKQDSELTKDGAPDTYLHGVKLFVVFIGLALAMFLIILDQTVRSYHQSPGHNPTHCGRSLIDLISIDPHTCSAYYCFGLQLHPANRMDQLVSPSDCSGSTES